MEDTPEQPAEVPDQPADEQDPGWPIGFLIFVGLGAFYLIVRFVQLGIRFFEWLS